MVTGKGDSLVRIEKFAYVFALNRRSSCIILTGLFQNKSAPVLPNSSVNSRISVGEGTNVFLRPEIFCVFILSVNVKGKYILYERPISFFGLENLLVIYAVTELPISPSTWIISACVLRLKMVNTANIT